MDVKRKIFSGITRKQTVEFGLVAILVTSFFAFWLNDRNFMLATIILSLITIIAPMIFLPFAALWFGLSRILSVISSTVILCLIFFLVVTPVGIIRRMLGKDSLKIKQFKKSKKSVLISRDHLYSAADMADTF